MSSTPSLEAQRYRLPTNVKPTHYDLAIRTDLEKLTFNGFVKISLDVLQETSSITLNTSDLELSTASIYSDVLKIEQPQSGESFDTVAERVIYSFPTVLPAGSKAELRIGFGGKLTGGMAGYYKSSWEHEGKTKFYALTQFEAAFMKPTAARRAFPCWDEPLLKATFAITLISRTDTVNLSNMPAISEEVYNPKDRALGGATPLADLLSSMTIQDDKWKVTRFQTTPPMSSYIVAFANGPFEYLEKSVVMPLSGKTLPLRIYATADHIHQAQFALDVKADVLPLYEKIFDVPYPLPKLDTLVVIVSTGAMENWGLITGRTNAFLLDPKSADLQARKQVATTQSHEVAHMWFGNITTMEWWNYLYLNEGFATLLFKFDLILSFRVFPEWKVDSEFISDHLNRALSLDAKLSSHPIEVDCPDANHINQIFDSLSYSKAASVLRMLSNYVGEELFLKGVSLYLKKKLYANSVTNDLWEGIRTATGIDIIRLMDNWISKMGFPVLIVTETSTGIHIRQDRFLETGHAKPEDNETLWHIPLNILSIDGSGKAVVNKAVILKEREMTLELDTGKPFKLNAGTVGVYRVLYTPERLAKIAAEASKQEGTSVFSLNDRIGLVHDAMALSKAGFAKLSSALTLIDGLKGETEYLVWSGIADSLSSLVSVWWEHPRLVDQINAFRRALFVPLVTRLGYEYADTDSTDTSLLRTCAITQAAAARDHGIDADNLSIIWRCSSALRSNFDLYFDRVIEELQNRFAYFMKTGNDYKIPADLQRVTFSAAVRHGGRLEYEAVRKVHDKPKTPTSRISAILAMGATEDPELMQETFQFILSKARDQDVIYFFRGLSVNSKARRPLVHFFKDEYDNLYKRFEANFMLKSLVEMSVGPLSTGKDYAEVVEFFKAGIYISKYSQGLAQSLDSIRAKAAFIEVSNDGRECWYCANRQQRSSDDLAEWFDAR
ncbi:hypothetical protein L208DRAFT_1272750 [Tricholoma matsutake]|nr:hypothetical protein L208DRAFT_1272750 [Tricholoma matsutake 945]